MKSVEKSVKGAEWVAHWFDHSGNFQKKLRRIIFQGCLADGTGNALIFTSLLEYHSQAGSTTDRGGLCTMLPEAASRSLKGIGTLYPGYLNTETTFSERGIRRDLSRSTVRRQEIKEGLFTF